jgi:hypothetical protein
MDAYSEDRRKKIVQALTEQRMTMSEAARVFSVSHSSVKRYAKAVREGRSRSADLGIVSRRAPIGPKFRELPFHALGGIRAQEPLCGIHGASSG